MFTLIGDIVGSRKLPDRASAQRIVGDALTRVNDAIDTVQLLETTVGHEVQGGFATSEDSALATLLIRLMLPPGMDMRFGLGQREVKVSDSTRKPLLQHVPGFWTAREAIGKLTGRHGTWYVRSPDEPGDARTPVRPQGTKDRRAPDPAAVNAFLLARDALVATLNDRQHRMLLLSLKGKSQRAIAAVEGISESAVSQAFTKGVRAARDAQVTFGKA